MFSRYRLLFLFLHLSTHQQILAQYENLEDDAASHNLNSDSFEFSENAAIDNENLYLSNNIAADHDPEIQGESPDSWNVDSAIAEELLDNQSQEISNHEDPTEFLDLSENEMTNLKTAVEQEIEYHEVLDHDSDNLKVSEDAEPQPDYLDPVPHPTLHHHVGGMKSNLKLLKSLQEDSEKLMNSAAAKLSELGSDESDNLEDISQTNSDENPDIESQFENQNDQNTIEDRGSDLGTEYDRLQISQYNQTELLENGGNDEEAQPHSHPAQEIPKTIGAVQGPSPTELASNELTEMNDYENYRSDLDETEDEESNKVDVEPIQALETGANAAIAEQKSSNKIFFILSILGLSIMVIHALIKFHLHYVPESLVVMMLGMLIGALLNNTRDDDWLEAEFLHPETFFLLLLPPIILEAGYNLNKVTFFSNLGTILMYAVFGTIISSLIVGIGIYLIALGASNYTLTVMEAAAYGSLISAVDPVATIAIFSAMNVDPTLNMLVFGESILNDAVSIVLTNMFQNAASWDASKDGSIINHCVYEFTRMFIGSASLGCLTAIVTALILKHLDLRRTPSLELGMMLVFSYIPYGLAEASQLSGIMALLFSGIVMSHYAHHNLSLVTQINLQHTLRTLAFLAETSVFAYIGMAMWSFEHDVQPSFCVGSIILILLARACNIYPLSYLLNKFREPRERINSRMQFIMWFSGLRGAIAYVLSLHLDVGDVQIRRIVITGTLSVVIFTIVILGGSTYPLIKFLKITGPSRNSKPHKSRNRNKKDLKKQGHVTLSKTEVLTAAIESDAYVSVHSHDSDSDKDSESDLEDQVTMSKNLLKTTSVQSSNMTTGVFEENFEIFG